MSSIEDNIIATQRSIITIQDELKATNDSIIALLKKDNDRLTEENAMMRTTQHSNPFTYIIVLEQINAHSKTEPVIVLKLRSEKVLTEHAITTLLIQDHDFQKRWNILCIRELIDITNINKL